MSDSTNAPRFEETLQPDSSPSAPEPSHDQAAPVANGNALKDSVVNNTSAAVNAVANHPTTQATKESLTTGPVAESVKSEGVKTSNDISGLAGARKTPDQTAATGQSLTHYHSFFYTLLRWEHPRATAISFATSILFIFACRYLPILRWVFKISYLAFGVTALAEIVGKSVTGTGVAASLRPRRYYRVPKETLETFLDDVEQLINFFVIEFQRVLFAENVTVTVGAFLTAFFSYYLVKLLPLWGLTLLSTCTIYLAPLVYLQNKVVIDSHIEHAGNVVSAQTAQIKGLAGENANRGFESVKAYTGDYATKAQGLIGQARQKIPVGAGGTGNNAGAGAGQNLTAEKKVQESEFPAAPKTELGGQAQPATPASGGDAVPNYS